MKMYRNETGWQAVGALRLYTKAALPALFHGYVQTGDRVSMVYYIFLFLFLKKKKEIYG